MYLTMTIYSGSCIENTPSVDTYNIVPDQCGQSRLYIYISSVLESLGSRLRNISAFVLQFCSITINNLLLDLLPQLLPGYGLCIVSNFQCTRYNQSVSLYHELLISTL